MSISNRLANHFALAAVATAAVAATSNAAVVYSGVINFACAVDIDGCYINVQTNILSNGPASGVPGWDVNPYSSGGGMNFFNSTGGGQMRYPGVTAGPAGNLALGTSIGAGNWRGATTKVRDINGMGLGLLGFGAIARDVALLAQPFGFRIMALGRPGRTETLPPGIVQAPDLETLLRHSDVLSVHCPYSPQTHHIINTAALAAMPAGSYLVNTARGGIVDEAALAAALDSGHLAGAGLDVFETEPPPASHPLRQHPRALITPHVSGVTDGSLVNMGLMAAECIAAHLTGAPVPAERIVVAG